MLTFVYRERRIGSIRNVYAREVNFVIDHLSLLRPPCLLTDVDEGIDRSWALDRNLSSIRRITTGWRGKVICQLVGDG